MISPTKPVARDWRPNILMFGASGTGKTRTWLDLVKITGARALVIDTHHGTDAWAASYPDGWDVVHTSSPEEIEDQIDHYLARRSDYTAFVIDDISVVHTELQDRADDELRPIRTRRDQSVGRFGSVMDPGSWGVIKRMAAVTTNKLTHLPMARIVVARSKPHYEASTGSGGKLALERKGKTWSGDKDLEYSFDLVLQLEKFGDRRVAVVEKARGMRLPTTIDDFDAQKLLDLLPCGPAGFRAVGAPEPMITREQADSLRALFSAARLAPGRQSAALHHYGAISIDDLPARHYLALVGNLRSLIDAQLNTSAGQADVQAGAPATEATETTSTEPQQQDQNQSQPQPQNQ